MSENTLNFKEILSVSGVLAPMAGFTDSAFRRQCMKHGAGLCVSEMISAKAVHMGDKKSLQLMAFHPNERPFGIQLFGSEPEDFAYAAKLAYDMFHPDFIDINMGCPAPKITGPGGGSKLMLSPKLASEIAARTVESVPIPVSCKIRAGFKEVTAPSLAPLLQDAGISCIFIHGRTRDQMYHPPVDYDVIRDVKNSVSIPVVGNGDILDSVDALRMISLTGCDGVMVGRGALGNPFIFSEISSALRGEEIPSPATLQQKLSSLYEQACDAVEDKGEYTAIHEMRKHMPYPLKGVNGAAALRAQSVTLCTLEDVKNLCEKALEAGMRDAQDN